MTNAERYRTTIDRLFHRKDDSAFDDLFAPTYTGEYGGQTIDRETFRQRVFGFRAALGDIRYDVVETAEVGDRVWAQWKVTAVHRAPLFGIEATHAPVAITGMTVNRFVDGKVVWGMVQWDRMTLADALRAASSQLALGV